MTRQRDGRAALPGQRTATVVLLLSIAWLAWNAGFQSRSIEAIADDPAAVNESNEVALRIDVNSASAAELALLPGIGPRLAERIIALRQEHGPFESVADLQRVHGIGPRTVEKIQKFAVAE